MHRVKTLQQFHLTLPGMSEILKIIFMNSGLDYKPLHGEKPFKPFSNRAEPDQAALVRAAWSGSTLFAYGI